MDKSTNFISSQRNKSGHRPLPVTFLISLVLLGSILSACSNPLGNQTASTSYQFTFAPSQQAKVILVCDDRTGSVKGAIYEAGLRLATRNLAGIIHEGQGSITFTFAKIDHHSHLPESTLVTGLISAVKPMPQQPLFSPFLDPTVKKQILDQYTHLQHEAEQSLQQAQAQAARLEAEVMQNDSRHVPVDNVGTDIMGCLLKANDLFIKAPGVRHYLLVISDLVQNVSVSDGVALLLPSVTASVVFYCSDLAKVCQYRKLMYQSLLTKAGAQVTFYDVSQIDLLNGVFGD